LYIASARLPSLTPPTTNLGNSGGIDGDAVERAEIDDYAAILTTKAE